MIHANIISNGNKIESFKLTGHAGFAAEGSDIVCSAVSVLTINAVNTLEKLLQLDIALVEKPTEGGYLEFSISEKDQQDPEVQLILDSLVLGLSDIEKSYPKYIKLKYKNR